MPTLAGGARLLAVTAPPASYNPTSRPFAHPPDDTRPARRWRPLRAILSVAAVGGVVFLAENETAPHYLWSQSLGVNHGRDFQLRIDDNNHLVKAFVVRNGSEHEVQLMNARNGWVYASFEQTYTGMEGASLAVYDQSTGLCSPIAVTLHSDGNGNWATHVIPREELPLWNTGRLPRSQDSEVLAHPNVGDACMVQIP